MKEQTADSILYKLDPVSIDNISGQIGKFLESSGAEHHEVIRNKLSAECCLEIWAQVLGKENNCILKTGSKFGRKYLLLETPGSMVNPKNPISGKDEENQKVQLLIDNTGILSSIGFMPEYHYYNGNNSLKIWTPARKQGKKLLKVALLAVLLVLVIVARKHFPSVAVAFSDYVINPIYSLFVRILSAICGPLVLFSIMTSICRMGDKNSFGLVGSVVVRRFMIMSFVLVALTCSVFSFFFHVELIGTSNFSIGLQSIIQLIVEIIPSDIVSPFTTGNALQIVFIGVILGFTILFLSNSVSDLANLVNQIHRVILQIMQFIGIMMPYFMGTAILKLVLSSTFSQIAGILKPTLLIWAGYIFMIFAETIIVVIQTKTSVSKLLKTTFEASIIGLSTASSTAAMQKMHENCTTKLGVSDTVADFTIPLGQVLYKPAASLSFFICAMYIAEKAGITINPVFLIMNFFISWILGIPVAPVAGALISCMGILFLQLGIPEDYIALGISISLLLDNIGAMTNVQLLQEEAYASQKAINIH